MRPFSIVVAAALAVATAPRAARAQSLEPPPSAPAGSPGAQGPQPPPRESTNAEEEEEDSGLGLEWVWARAEGGYSYVNMESLSSGLQVQQTSGSGASYGATAGVRLFFLTIGITGRNLQISSLGNLVEFGGEVGLHMRVWRLDPYFGVRGAWAWLGSFDTTSIKDAAGSSPGDLKVRGVAVGPTLGLDVYLTKWLTVGAQGGAELLFLKKPPADLPPQFSNLGPMQQAQIKSDPLYQNSGSSVGVGLGAMVQLGLHF